MRRKADQILAKILPDMRQLLWVAVLVACIGLGRRMLNIDGDLGRHLTIGGYILDSGSVPVRDLFSHTMSGQPVVPHEWLSQVIFALAYRLLGLDGVVLSWVNYEAELAYWISNVLPVMEQAGLRRPCAPAQRRLVPPSFNGCCICEPCFRFMSCGPPKCYASLFRA